MLAPLVLRPRCPACRFAATNAARTLSVQSHFRLLPPSRTSIQAQAQILARASKPQQSQRFYQSQDEIRERLRRARPLLSDPSADRFVNAGRSTSSRAFVIACVAAAVAFYFFNSQTVPGTGRRRFNFLSDWFVERLGRRGAEEVVQDIREQGGRFIPERDRRFLRIKSVMARLVPVSGMADEDWKIMLIDDDGTFGPSWGLELYAEGDPRSPFFFLFFYSYSLKLANSGGPGGISKRQRFRHTWRSPLRLQRYPARLRQPRCSGRRAGS